MIYDNLAVNEKGHLTFAGYDTVELAEKYGTPLYLMDEDKIRQRVREYKKAMSDFMPQGSVPEFASKAFSCRQIYRIMAEEGIDIDIVSVGELYTAVTAGFPMERAFFHGNNKTDSDIEFAIENGVGYFVVDNEDELYAVDRCASKRGVVQKILLRVTPGIDPHTHKKISTGSVESKFGIAIGTGQAEETVLKALDLENIELCGYHCHIGSQIFDAEPFHTASEIMLKFIADIKDKYGYSPDMLNLGGGLGVRYVESEPEIDYYGELRKIAETIKKQCTQLQLDMPKILTEPGRSLVGDAGITLYTVGSVKEIKGYKNYVSVDGGMTDNPRYTLYESPYTVILASRPEDKKDFTATVAGRCCESGDLIQEDVAMPRPGRGEILAVLTTGAYNYSMASNYNRIPRPPVVMLNSERDYIAVKRETLEDICRLDV